MQNIIKRINQICLFGLLSFSSLLAQHNFELNNQGALIRITSGADVYVWGDVHMDSSSTFNHDGFMEVQGNMSSELTFQQRGAGLVRMQNNDVNVNERQFIQGSYAVRGGQSQIGVDDGSFYNLELANNKAVVHLVGNGPVADVRNSVDFNPAAAVGSPPLNRIVTHDTNSVPANGNGYSATFGMMNPAAGLGNFVNNTVTSFGNMSIRDSGFVQGNLRRAILGAGGQYGWVNGLEPGVAGAARGIQYTRIDFGVNTYDVVSGYFEQGSPNVIAGTPTECAVSITYFGGADHGEWVFNDINTVLGGAYQMWVWPQDDQFPLSNIWFITKNDTIKGQANDCGPSPVGLDRNAFNGFSQFGVAAEFIPLPVERLDLFANPVNNRFIKVNWETEEELNVSHYEIERSTDLVNFEKVGMEPAKGNILNDYEQNDYNVAPNTIYYYRIKIIDLNSSSSYTNYVEAMLTDFVNNEISIWPNPVDNELNISLTSEDDKSMTLEVTNAIGQRVYLSQEEIVPGLNHFEVPANSWSPGTYFVHFRNASHSISTKIFKRR